MLRGKNIILTGAGRGIGRVVAEHASKNGATLALLARTETELKETYEVVRKINSNCFYEVCDISDEKSILQAKKAIEEKFDKIDVLINNAGIQTPIGPFFSSNLHEWTKTIEINLLGTVMMSHHFLPRMIQRNQGKIINLSGGGATSPRPNFSAYGVSKTAIVRFTETIAEELKDYNIDVNAVAPGAINTRMLTEVLNAENAAGDEYHEAQKRQVEGGNDPMIAARLICFLASDESNGITGKLLSAPWDRWNDSDFCSELKNNIDLATLRRIDNKIYFRKK